MGGEAFGSIKCDEANIFAGMDNFCRQSTVNSRDEINYDEINRQMRDNQPLPRLYRVARPRKNAVNRKKLPQREALVAEHVVYIAVLGIPKPVQAPVDENQPVEQLQNKP